MPPSKDHYHKSVVRIWTAVQSILPNLEKRNDPQTGQARMLSTAPSTISTLTIFASHVGSCFFVVLKITRLPWFHRYNLNCRLRYWQSTLLVELIEVLLFKKGPYYQAQRQQKNLVFPEISFCIQFHQIV